MAVFKRRLVFWLIRAYFKKWGKFIFISFLIGLVCFFILKQFLFNTLLSLTTENKQNIGIVGSYTINSVPQNILLMLSEGLTTVGDDGIIHAGLATSWKISDDGLIYTFALKKGVVFTDGTAFTAKDIHLPYSDVKVDRPNPYSIVFHLKGRYAPFLSAVSAPLFKRDFIGTGPFVLSDIKLNGSFIQTLSLVSKSDAGISRVYQLYPTLDALKLAFTLGEVSTVTGLSDISFQNTSFSHFPNARITKSVNYGVLVTLFYDTQDSVLSDKRIRDAFSYVIPNSFFQGIRAYSSIPPVSWAYSNLVEHTQDLSHATVLLNAAGGVKKLPVFTIDTLPKYELLARSVQKLFAAVGVRTKIVDVTDIPTRFQIFLGDFTVPKDPDQYTLWHSYQSNNITNFNTDKRIDKLLEDGRQTVDQTSRAAIYADFQKYLTDEQPATFLYFPYSYTIKRK